MSAEAIAAFVGAGVNFLALLFVAGQVAIANRQLKHAQHTNEAEIRRRKRQATIDYFMSTVVERAELASELPDPSASADVKDAVKRALDGDARCRRLIGDYLGFYETMAVAIASDVYDLETLDAMDGASIRYIADSYQHFFEAVRATPGRSAHYVELERLGLQIQHLRGPENSYVPIALRSQVVRNSE
ncbi:DUF4760 domain-containing protein [Actinomycetospora atypica]|uniref:DUF4760 domain-containing protein n=1 Tax=Actinomycetospora atypica TaxID=1290095 RepID=A0ABV9YIS2_9PSEU